MELEYRFATADDIEDLMQTRLDMLSVVTKRLGVHLSASLRSCRLLPIRQGSGLT